MPQTNPEEWRHFSGRHGNPNMTYLIKFFWCVLVLPVLVSVEFVFAVESGQHEHGSHFECPLPKDAQDVVKCAKENHPDILRKKNEVDHAKFSEDAARQIPNPELDAEIIKGTGDLSSSTVGILQAVEWGGKRSSKISSARARISFVDAELKDIQAEVVRETVKNLHRLRQIEQEKKVLSTTIQTLEKLISQQASRLNLPPEQQVTLSVYRMALMDSKIKSSELFDEERALEHYFHVSTGHSLDELQSVLPKAPAVWPNLESNNANALASTGLLKALAEKNEFLAEAEFAKAATWPSLKIGPMWSSQTGAGEPTQSLFGLRVMMDLPVLNWNSGSRSFARAGILRSEKNISLLREEERHERREQLKVYQSALATLKAVPEVGSIEKDFQRNESLARRGLISGPLLIEFHRQRAELTRSRNTRELKAIEALWRIYQFDGRIFSEVL